MKPKQHLRVLFLAVRPKTLSAAVAPVMIGTTMAYAGDRAMLELHLLLLPEHF